MRETRGVAAGIALGLTLVLALLATGCAPAEEETPAEEEETGMPAEEGAGGGELGAGEAPDGETTGEAEQIFLEGRLTDEGVECPAFRSDDDELYTLTGDLAGFVPGDRVRIVATPVEVSTCMQGTTVAVVEISAIEEEPPES